MASKKKVKLTKKIEVPMQADVVIDPTATRYIPGSDGFPNSQCMQWELLGGFQYEIQSIHSGAPDVWQHHADVSGQEPGKLFLYGVCYSVEPGAIWQVFRCLVKA